MPRTILVTGITGFIAKKIAYDLLARGDTVRGTLRKSARSQEVRAALSDLPPEALARLTFVEADLMTDRGWAEAMGGVDGVIHTASPFPLSKPKDDSQIIGPAVEGTKRVLRSAHKAGVRRVVLTSSMEAVMHGVSSNPLTEADWSDPEALTCSPYTRSKIFAERAAWEFVKSHPEMQLSVINPGLVCGTPMDKHTDHRSRWSRGCCLGATRCSLIWICRWWISPMSRPAISLRWIAPKRSTSAISVPKASPISVISRQPLRQTSLIVNLATLGAEVSAQAAGLVRSANCADPADDRQEDAS